MGVHPDESRAATQPIGPGGGTISVTDGRGTRFTLVIPRDAVVSPTQITMTPVSSIDGLPLSKGLLGAVQLGPEGMTFSRPLTLTLVSTQPLHGGLPIAFGYHGAGSEFHLQPGTATQTGIRLTLWHFSGAGLGSGTQADVNDQNQYPPSSPQDRVDQALANPALSAEERAAVLHAFYIGTLRPLLLAGESGGDLPATTLSLYASWRSMVEQSDAQSLLAEDLAAAATAAHATYSRTLVMLGQMCLHDGSVHYLPATGTELPLGTGGWVTDLGGVKRFRTWYVQANALLGQTSNVTELDQEGQAAFKLCRPAGFEFKGLTGTLTAGFGPSLTTISYMLSGYICGPDPFAGKWKISAVQLVNGHDSTPHEPKDVELQNGAWAQVVEAGEAVATIDVQLMLPALPDGSPDIAGAPKMAMQMTPLSPFGESGSDSPVDVTEERTVCS